MRNTKKILSSLLVAIAYAHAGGAANLVAQKSKTKDYNYSWETKELFVNKCSKGANKNICNCVLQKLQHQYSEVDYWNLEHDLRQGIDHPNYISYVTDAIEECDEEYSNTSSKSSKNIDNGYASLLGDGGGGIATKAKGSVKTPSEHNIEFKSENETRSATDIMKVIRQRTPGLRHIYSKFLKMKPGFKGTVTLRFSIAPNGSILKIFIASSTTGFREFDEEIRSAVSRWKFHKIQTGKALATIPFTFEE